MKAYPLRAGAATVTEIGLGCMALCPLDLAEAVRVVHACLEVGVRFFETAAGYETSEWKLGIALAGCQARVVIASKSRGRSREGVLRHVQTSLLRLRVESIDVYQMHYVNRLATLDEVCAADGALAGLVEARRRGWIRHIGITGHFVATMLEALDRFPFDTVQMPYNVVNRYNLPALRRARELGALAIGNKPFMAGQLLGRGFTPQQLASAALSGGGPQVIIPGLSSPDEVAALFTRDPTHAEPRHTDAFDAFDAFDVAARDAGRGASLFPNTDRCAFCRAASACPEGLPVREWIRAHEILAHYTTKSTRQAVQLFLDRERDAMWACLVCGADGGSVAGCGCLARCGCATPLRDRLMAALAFATAPAE